MPLVMVARRARLNRALAAVSGIGARDEVEGMLATQMVATHFAAMSVLRRLKGSETIPQQDSNGNLAIKLLRTLYNAGRSAPTLSRQGAAESYGRARSCAFRRASDRRHRPPGGREQEEIGGQAPAPRGITHEPGAPMWS